MKKKKSALFVLTYYRPHWTGLTKYAARLAETLAKRGWKVGVVCVRHDRSAKRKEMLGGVAVKRVSYVCRVSRTFFTPGFIFKVWQEMKNYETVVVYLPLQQVWLVALMAKLRKKKMVLVHNGDLKLPDKGGLISRLMEKIYYYSTLWAGNLSQVIIIQTTDYAKKSDLLKKLKLKWRVVMPLFDQPEVTKNQIIIFKKKYNLTGKKLIGFSGRFVEEKGVGRLLRAMPYLIKRMPDLCLAMAGDDKIKYENYWQRLKPLVRKNKKHIKLLGLLEEKEVYVFYRCLEALIQPSKSDCFPSSQNEALLSGIPSVCSNIPGARWPVKVTGMGKIVDTNKTDKLVEAIVEVIKNKEKYIKNWPKVKQMFDRKKTIKKYEKILE